MNAIVTRRALLGATAAMAAVVLPAVPVARIPDSNSDADLSTLLDRWHETRAAWDATDVPLDEALRRAAASYPPRPEVLLWRLDDMPKTNFGRGLSDPEGWDGSRVYGERAVNWLRHRPAATWLPTLTLPHEREVRRVEVVEAFDGWMAARRTIENTVGFTAASDAEDASAAAWNEADEALKLYKPRTLAGLARKADWIAARLSCGGCDDDLGEVFATQVAAFVGLPV